MRSGYGSVYNAEGNFYVGEYKNGKYHGYGHLKNNDD